MFVVFSDLSTSMEHIHEGRRVVLYIVSLLNMDSSRIRLNEHNFLYRSVRLGLPVVWRITRILLVVT